MAAINCCKRLLHFSYYCSHNLSRKFTQCVSSVESRFQSDFQGLWCMKADQWNTSLWKRS